MGVSFWQINTPLLVDFLTKMLNNITIQKGIKLKITPQQHIENYAQTSRHYRQERLIGEWQQHIGISNFEKHLTGTEWANYKEHRKQQRKISRLKAQESRLVRKAQLIDDAKSQ